MKRSAFFSTVFSLIYILVFNPLWYPVMHHKMLYLLVRFEALVPSTVVSAYLLFELWQWARRREHALSNMRAVLGLIAVAICLGYPLVKLPGAFIYSKGRIERLLPYELPQSGRSVWVHQRELPAGEGVSFGRVHELQHSRVHR